MPQTQPISIQRVLIAADFHHLIVICPSAETAITADAKIHPGEGDEPQAPAAGG